MSILKKKVSLNASRYNLVRRTLEPFWCPSIMPNKSAKELVIWLYYYLLSFAIAMLINYPEQD